MCAVPIGLDYQAVEILRRAYRHKGGRDLWDRLKVLEGAALELMIEKAERESRRGGR